MQPKFAFCENRIIFETRRNQVIFSADFDFSRFWYITSNNKVLCGLMGGETSSGGAKTMWGLCGLMGAKQALTGQRLCVGSVGCWWAAGGLWHVFTTISLLCIAGAFPKFAIFENRFFFKTRRSQVKRYSTDFLFFSRFWYITLNSKVLCGLMGGGNKLWWGEDHVGALWADGR